MNSITSPSRKQLILETISNCCLELDPLKLTGFHFTEDMVLRLRSIEKKIKLTNCGMGMISLMVRYMPAMEIVAIHHFELESIRNNEADKLVGLTKLKSLELNCSRLQIVPSLNQLMAAQIPLECLQLYRQQHNNMNSDFADAISQFTQLKKLRISFQSKSVDDTFVSTHMIGIHKCLDELIVLKISTCRPSQTAEIVCNAPI